MTADLALHADRPGTLLVVSPGPAHADLALGGSVARWVGEGSLAHLVCCSSGDASGDDATADPLEVAARRERAQRAAAARLGYASVTFLHRPEGAVANDLALREQLVRLIRTLRPDALGAPDPRAVVQPDGRLLHADVRASGHAALDAVEPARRAMAFSWLATAEGLASHVIRRLYLYGSAQPTAALDISSTLALKLAALADHADFPEASEEAAVQVRREAVAIAVPLGLAAAEACVVLDLPG